MPYAEDPMIAAAALIAAAAIALLVMTAHPALRDRILAFVIGASGVLIGLQAGGANAFTILVLGWTFLHLRRTAQYSGAMVALLISAGLIASTVLAGDLVASPTLAVQLIGLAVSAVLFAAYTTPRDRLVAMYGALTTICVGCVYGIGQLFGVFPSRAEVVHLDVSTVGRPSGIWPEPDWLGMYAAVGVLLAFHLPMRRWVRVAAMSLCTVLWVLAFARAGWVALVVVAAVMVAVRLTARKQIRPPKGMRGRVLAVLGSAAAVMVPLWYFSDIAADLAVRLQRTFSAQSDDISGQARIQQTEGLLHLADIAPWYGHGLSAAGRVGVSGKLYLAGDGHGNNVASNWVLGVWVDAQYLAIPFILVIAALIALTIRAFAGQFLLLIAVNSLFTNATYLPVFWFAIALALATIAERRRVGPILTGESPNARGVEESTGEHHRLQLDR